MCRCRSRAGCASQTAACPPQPARAGGRGAEPPRDGEGAGRGGRRVLRRLVGRKARYGQGTDRAVEPREEPGAAREPSPGAGGSRLPCAPRALRRTGARAAPLGCRPFRGEPGRGGGEAWRGPGRCGGPALPHAARRVSLISGPPEGSSSTRPLAGCAFPPGLKNLNKTRHPLVEGSGFSRSFLCRVPLLLRGPPSG